LTAQRVRMAGVCFLTALCLHRHSLADFATAPVKIELIPPGTIIAEQAPEPWTHLIVKSQPRVTAGDLGKISKTQVRLAGMFFMATLARVERVNEGGNVSFRLGRLASGLGTNVNGRDTIVSPDTTGRLGANVGFLGGILLDEMYDKQRSVEIVLRSETSAVYDTPIVIRVGNKNRTLVLRYGVLVDPQSGQLDTLAWLIDVDDSGRYLGLSGNMQWLAPNKVMTCDLYVDKSEYTFGIPSDNAFACMKIPQGRLQFAVKDRELATLLTKKRWTQAEAAAVDARLRDMVRRGQATVKNTPPR